MGDRSARVVPVRVIGLGNPMRSDDGVGRYVLSLLAGRVPPAVDLIEGPGEATALLPLWRGAALAIVLDAVRSGRSPGTVVAWRRRDGPLPPTWRSTSTHAFSLGEAIALGEALGELPRELCIVGVEGGRFDTGGSLSPPVEAGAHEAAELVLHELRAVGGGPDA